MQDIATVRSRTSVAYVRLTRLCRRRSIDQTVPQLFRLGFFRLLFRGLFLSRFFRSGGGFSRSGFGGGRFSRLSGSFRRGGFFRCTFHGGGFRRRGFGRRSRSGLRARVSTTHGHGAQQGKSSKLLHRQIPSHVDTRSGGSGVTKLLRPRAWHPLRCARLPFIPQPIPDCENSRRRQPPKSVHTHHPSRVAESKRVFANSGEGIENQEPSYRVRLVSTESFQQPVSSLPFSGLFHAPASCRRETSHP